MLSLRKSIARYVGHLFDVAYDPTREVLVTVGVSEAIDLALRALLNPGDEVIFHEPCYVSYSPSIVLAHGRAVPVETSKADAFSLKPDNLAPAITPQTRVLMLNCPTNPTGAVASREDLEGIAKLAIQHDLIVLTDEIYSELRYDGLTHLSIASLPGMRFFRATVVVALAEELFWRGFLMRFVCDWEGDYWRQPFGRASWLTYLIVTGLFIFSHDSMDWAAAWVYGSLTYLLCVLSKSLGACVMMHATANFLMGLYIIAYGKFGLW